jgi:hypothetical protein
MRFLLVALAFSALVGCTAEKQAGPGPQPGAQTFVAENGADVARQIFAYSSEFARAFRAGEPLPKLVMKNGEPFSSGNVINFRDFASSTDRADFKAQFPNTAGFVVNEAKAQQFEAFLNSITSGDGARAGGFRGLGFGVPQLVGIVADSGCGFPIVFFPCVQFGMPGLCVNCFAHPGGCNVGANAWACGWFPPDCNRCFPL